MGGADTNLCPKCAVIDDLVTFKALAHLLTEWIRDYCTPSTFSALFAELDRFDLCLSMVEPVPSNFRTHFLTRRSLASQSNRNLLLGHPVYQVILKYAPFFKSTVSFYPCMHTNLKR